jgi:hypothetical protein
MRRARFFEMREPGHDFSRTASEYTEYGVWTGVFCLLAVCRERIFRFQVRLQRPRQFHEEILRCELLC